MRQYAGQLGCRSSELDAWRTRPLGEVKYLVLDARYEKMRHGGVVRDAAVLSAIGIGPDERRRVLGVSVALSEARRTEREIALAEERRSLFSDIEHEGSATSQVTSWGKRRLGVARP